MGKVLRNTFSWSFSRNETFRHCLRRYYYHYYGTWGGWSADADPQVRRLYLLKQLKTRHLWAGAVVHETVAGVLERLRAGHLADPPGALAEATAERAVQRMRREFRDSRDGRYRTEPRKRLGLIEHHYGPAVADEAWRELAAMVRRSIQHFFAGEHLADLRAVPPAAWLALEDLETFPVAEVPVYVKMDLAYRSGEDHIVILDWKTGRRDPRPGGLQLACYALYAAERWGAAPEAITVREVNLNTEAVGEARVQAAELDAARATIGTSVAAMQARLTHPASNEARLADFPAQLSASGCRQCPFREVCPEYAEAFA